MGTHHVPLSTSITLGVLSASLLCSGALLLAETKKPTESGSGSRPLQVTISESFGMKFNLPKPPAPLDLPLDVVFPSSQGLNAGAKVNTLDTEAQRPLLEALGNPVSTHVMKPWLPEVPGFPVASFSIQFPAQAALSYWELLIYDSGGTLISSQRHTDISDRTSVEWDGETITKQPVIVGVPYAYKVRLTDRHKITQTFLGSSFTLPALQYKTKKTFVIEIAIDTLFSGRKADLTDNGKKLLSRALEILNEYEGSPHQFRMYDDEPSVVDQARLASIRQYASQELQILPENVPLVALAPTSRGRMLQLEITSSR